MPVAYLSPQQPPAPETEEEEMELRQGLFLRSQLGAIVTRGAIEDYYHGQREMQRERARMLKDEELSKRHTQRMVAREARNKRERQRAWSAAMKEHVDTEGEFHGHVPGIKSALSLGHDELEKRLAEASAGVQSASGTPRVTGSSGAAAVQFRMSSTHIENSNKVPPTGYSQTQKVDCNKRLGALRRTIKNSMPEPCSLPPDIVEQLSSSSGRKEASKREKCPSKPPVEESAEIAAMRVAFYRYDEDFSGALDFREIRAALQDIGLAPTSAEDKRAIVRVISEALITEGANNSELDFDAFQRLVPRLREAVRDNKRTELEDWFARGLDELGRYVISANPICGLRKALEVLGSPNVTCDEEWAVVLKIFEPLKQATEASAKAATKSRVSMRRSKTGKILKVESAALSSDVGNDQEQQFVLFESLSHQAQEKLAVMKREKERRLADDMALSDELLEEFRANLIELHTLFTKFDADGSGMLEADEIWQLLAACGCQQTSSFERKAAENLIARAKWMTRCQKDRANPTFFRADSCDDRAFSQRLLDEYSDELECNFTEFLTLMRLVRESNRESQTESLQGLFNRYDTDGSGDIQIKEIHRLFQDLGLSPKTREEQLEIRAILDEVDEDGNGCFDINEFMQLVQRVHERLERISRIDEEKFAMDIGLPLQRCRELRSLFQEVAPGEGLTHTALLGIGGLRQVVDRLGRRYDSRVLVDLFWSFGRETGGVDGRGLLRMFHAIEVAKTHGQPTRRGGKKPEEEDDPASPGKGASALEAAPSIPTDVTQGSSDGCQELPSEPTVRRSDTGGDNSPASC